GTSVNMRKRRRAARNARSASAHLASFSAFTNDPQISRYSADGRATRGYDRAPCPTAPSGRRRSRAERGLLHSRHLGAASPRLLVEDVLQRFLERLAQNLHAVL